MKQPLQQDWPVQMCVANCSPQLVEEALAVAKRVTKGDLMWLQSFIGGDIEVAMDTIHIPWMELTLCLCILFSRLTHT